MVAEDNQVNRLVINAMLASTQASIDFAENGLQATQMATSQHYDLVLMDIQMPEMDGYRLTHEIRSDPALQDLHIILHTSLSGNFNKAMVKKVGCDDFLSKFQPDELAEKVQSHLRYRLEKGDWQ